MDESAASPGHEWTPEANPWLIAAAMIFPTFMVALDTSVANVALPHIAGSLSASYDESTWVLTSYLVSNAIILPITGWLSNLYGRKRLLLYSVFLFTVASFLCGAAYSLGMLVVARVFQGASGGVLVAVSQAVLLESFPARKRGEAMAVFALGVIVAPIAGPTIGGWITDNYSWRWVFYINLPFGALATFFIKIVIEDPPYLKDAAPGKIDYVGFFLMGIGLGTLQIVLDRGQKDDWFDATWICWCSAVSVVALVIFVFYEWRTKNPIVNLRVFLDRNFSMGTMLGVVYGIILYGTLVMLPEFLQGLMGYPALESGLALSPRGIGALVATFVVGRIVRRVDSRILMVIGFTSMIYANLVFGRMTLDISMYSVIWPNVILGASFGMIFVPLTTLCMGTLPNVLIGTGTGLYNLMRSMGGSIGIAVISTMISRGSQLHQSLMVSHLTRFDPAFEQRLRAFQRLFISRGSDPILAAKQAYFALYTTLLNQANLWSFIDNFRFLGFLALVGMFLAVQMKTTAVRKEWR
jgi:DHA2 family multidrug resistance protein